MNEHRRKILEMLSTGQITADEAEKLIVALETGPAASGAASGSSLSPKAKPKYLRVIVNSEEGKPGSAKVNIRVPMELLRAGVRLASLIPVQAQESINQALRKDGLQFDLQQLKPENLEQLIDHLDDLTVDVDADDKTTQVRVFCE